MSPDVNGILLQFYKSWTGITHNTVHLIAPIFLSFTNLNVKVNVV